ncbi:MAG: YdcF family protein [Spirochaetia bacterium]|nr:YdcF family protein [Spirochaetia bacterium]
MFLLLKALKTFFLPPGIFILALLAVWILNAGFFGRKRNPRAAWPALIIGVFLYLLSIGPVAGFLLRPIEHRYDAASLSIPAIRPSAVVVLGGGLQPGTPTSEWKPLLSPDSLQRTMAGFELREKTGLPIVVSGGSVFGKGEAEAEVMARFLRKPGLQDGDVIVENRSRNTWENALYTREKLGEKSQSVYLVTSAFHMPRSVSFFRKTGFEVVPVPVAYRTGRKIGWGPLWYLPSMDAFSLSTLALHEYLGMTAYVFKKK